MQALLARRRVPEMGRGPGYYDEGGVWVSTRGLDRAVAQSRRGRRRRNNGGWTPRAQGTTEDGTEVTFREGLGDNEGHTLIADGHLSAREFDASHNHYGGRREGDGRVDDDRGHYTGPGH